MKKCPFFTLAILLLTQRASSSSDCSSFSSSVCRLKLDNVVSIQNYEDLSVGNLDNQCQFDCIQEPGCRNFTFFAPTVPGLTSTCILFNSCEESSFCGSCVSGPTEPPLDDCGVRLLLNSFLEDKEPLGLGPLEEQLSRQPKQLEEEAAGDGNVDAANTEAAEGSSVEDTREVVGAELDKAEAADASKDEGEGSVDAVNMDAGNMDAGNVDAGNMDAGNVDAGNMDAGNVDAGNMDAGNVDAGNMDAGNVDTGNVDGGNMDDENMDDGNMEENEEDADLPEVTGIDDGLLEGNDVETTNEEGSNEGEEETDNTDAEEGFFGEEDYEDGEETEETDSDGNDDDKKRPSFVYCLLGGYGPLGPLPSVDHLPSNALPVLPQVPPLPPAFPLGRDGMFGTMFNGNLLACSPGAPVNPTVLRPFIGGGPFGDGFISLGVPQRPRFLAPGQCYSNRDSNWVPVGGPMNRVRLGSSMTRMGNFLIASGGRTRDDPNDEVEVLNLDNPRKWRKLSKIMMKNATYDHCSVALNNTAVLVTGGVGQGNMAVVMNMKTREMSETESMRQPRSQHSCMRIKINGRPGVLVAGGSNEDNPAMRSVEFFDQGKETWSPLGRLRQGRRFPGIMVRMNRLIVAGGETTDPFGQNIILDSMERLGRRRWRPIRRRLPQGRSRFAPVRVPFNFF